MLFGVGWPESLTEKMAFEQNLKDNLGEECCRKREQKEQMLSVLREQQGGQRGWSRPATAVGEGVGGRGGRWGLPATQFELSASTYSQIFFQ